MLAAGRQAGPERTLLYQIVDDYFPAFVQHLEAPEVYLPAYVEQEFEDYLKCGRLEDGFLRVRYEQFHSEHLVAFSYKRRGFCPSCGARGTDGSRNHSADSYLGASNWPLSGTAGIAGAGRRE